MLDDEIARRGSRKALPASQGRQDELARMLIDVAADDLHPYQLTSDERAAVEEGLAQVKRGEFASDEQVAAMWKRWGL